MTTIEWVMLVEVAKDQRIRCDFEGCNYSVYRRIHVLKFPDGSYQCLGSGCFKKLCDAGQYQVVQAPSVKYLGQGKALTADQRQQLIDNRNELLERLLAQGLAEHKSISVHKLADTDAKVEIGPINISTSSPMENYHLLRKYRKFNPEIDYAVFPQGEKYSRALDMVRRKYRDQGLKADTGSVGFQTEVQSLIDDMVDYTGEEK